jgi:hypothetical protein
MVAFFTSTRKRLAATVLAGAMALAACDPGAISVPGLGLGGKVKVALLVPQSDAGGSAVVARDLENAARLAMADLDGIEIDLRVYDTGGNPAMAAAAADRALGDGAEVILGPLFAENTGPVGVAAAGRNVNVLSFSNNAAIAGGNVYILGSTFQNIAERLVDYSVRQGQDDIMIVYGQSPAENVGREAISRAIAARGARLASIGSFPLTQEGVINAIPDIADQAGASGAEAIFFTSGTDGALPFLADLLPENGVDPTQVQFIGLTRLDVPASALSLGGLQGAIFALPDPVLTSQFRSRYEAAFGTSPHPLAGLAYDGIAAIGALQSDDASGGLSALGLTRPNGFAGVNGVFRFRSNGTNERGLAVARIENQQVIFVEPAPRSFTAGGF